VEHQSSHRSVDETGQALSSPAAETIVAAATPPGRGGIAIVRISGPDVPAIACAMLGRLPPPRTATQAAFHGAERCIDTGLALYFPAPHSYTGEHVLELHGHGGASVVEALIIRAQSLGARRAQPGEFTRRAFLNGKLDLAQAEAVADLIDAASEASARAALRSLQGEFSRRVRSLGDLLRALRVQVEASIDFSEEELDTHAETQLRRALADAIGSLDSLLASSRQGRLLAEGLTVVIAGAPNAGKSTLLNQLTGHDSAIVTPIPGTTRDVLRERILLNGVPLHVLDTAGLRAEAGDAIEAEGMRRAELAMAQADHILFVVDAASDPAAAGFAREHVRLPSGVPVTLVFNKIDLPGAPQGPGGSGQRSGPDVPRLFISARSGTGLDALRAHLLAEQGGAPAEGALSARTRHIEALSLCGAHLTAARRGLEESQPRELVAEELRRSQLALAQLLGEESPDDLLGQIFSTFCIGK
jgi:tRNA modification GTPase